MKFISKFFSLLRRKKRVELVPQSATQQSDSSLANRGRQHPVRLMSPLPGANPHDTVIGDDALMTGNLTVSGRAIVRGKVSGVIAEGAGGANVYVDHGAAVRGELNASNLLVFGAVEGSVSATLISVEATAEVRGRISYKDIRIKGGVSAVELIKDASLTQRVHDQTTKELSER